ncbi:gamma-glutamyltransferase [Sphingobacterium sp. lm-10]|uniref:gamma-glutamyltransferase n=1 Tax=Sphingobacterium sp. lm-10 TaxID=2944904 RepID=UPI0020227F02|nr:gamma-glutamyltransferase [Sphingobacterium sp. lm-10]MCL7988498.1 gamma-glutamyltransferase [Sphingobacterium sp. lm-10]
MKILSHLLIAFLLFSSCQNKSNTSDSAKGNEFEHGAVVAAHPLASDVGVQILKDGGNAIDAAIAVQFALAVVYPNAGNIGGGGFMVYRSHDGGVDALDFRETAPLKSDKDMYLDADGNAITDLSLYGQLAAGVPGTVAGMVAAHQKYGSMDWQMLVAPAIKLAKEGFKITSMQAKEFNEHQELFSRLNTEGAAIIRSETWKEDDVFQQPELASTLERVAKEGRDGFYKGETADYIVKEMQRGNGIMSKADLENYQAVWRKPVEGAYRGHRVISMPPPSSGGAALIALLQSVESYPLAQWGFQSDSAVRVIVEAERRIYADRATHMGDPDYHKVPLKELMDNQRNKTRMQEINFAKATPSSEILASKFAGYESEETTHYCIVDKEGNAVSLTTTLNGAYGAGVWVKGAGFLLNNEMDDFSVKPGVPNLYGLVGGKANAIAPNKRMLSSMTPTIVEKDGKLFMVVGTPGGSTIITSVFQTITNVIDYGMDAQESVTASRFHHQWLPDQIDVEEKAIDAETRSSLEKAGYKIYKRGNIGRVENIIVLPNGKLQTGADPRGDDVARGY